MYWVRILSRGFVLLLLLAIHNDVTVAQSPPPAGQTGPSNGPTNQPSQGGPNPGPQASPQVGPAPASSVPGGNPNPASGSSPMPPMPAPSVNVTQPAAPQFPNLTRYPNCVSQCLTTAASAANCNNVTAVDCYCSKPIFSGTIVNCTALQCIGNLYLSQNVSQQYCNLAQSPVQLSFPNPPPVSSTLPSTSITPVPIVTAIAPPSSGAVRAWDDGKAAVLAFSAVFVGAVVGSIVVG